MKTNIYIDGFNLYYGAVKHTPYRWLNLAQMCQLLLPKDKIQRIKYSVELSKYATFVKHIRPKVLAKSQFLANLSDREGVFSKPASW